MEERKKLCAQIPINLHSRVRQEQQESGKPLGDYITEVLTEYYEGGHNTMAATRTLAIQISEELLERIKTYLTEESRRQWQQTWRWIQRWSREKQKALLWRKSCWKKHRNQPRSTP